eukprot:TRINITY_DN62496_c0_g1_i2.p1 TRINITY_DN62496_c0_g1~~TRINITY_DN62496_c0_g1_i2.p1  ORF type:complete len:530 (-),score=295.51 TRINITY_DN62496_c0_g1_i2:52-1641(-)
MSSQPRIAARKSAGVQVEAGKEYAWCRCGHSKNQPWHDPDSCIALCDGGLMFTPDKSETVYLCQCKRSGNKPYCDGTHRTLSSKSGSKPKKKASSSSAVRDIEDLAGSASSSSSSSAIPEPTEEEPTLSYIKELARDGLSKVGHHGPVDAMGVPGPTLPRWKDIQLLVAQLATKPLLDDVPVSTKLVIGPNAKKPLVLDIPIFVSDMSFGALSREAKVALSRGAQLAGTGICSGEGGMLPAEQKENERYFYELASAKFGWDLELVKKVQAFHFKGGQGAKTGTGGHLPGNKVTEEIASVRNLPAGQSAISPATFTDMTTPEDFKSLADKVRDVSGGIPIGFKLSANHIEADIDFALAASADYIILDGRGGATGAAPTIFRDNISVPTIPAIARARRHLDKRGAHGVTLIATGGLRIPADFIKAMCLGADGVAIANSALQSIGCVAARMCNTNMCPAGVATQRPELRARLNVDKSAKQLQNFLQASAHLMQVMARACGHAATADFNTNDITTWHRDMADLAGISFAGVRQ